MVDVAKELYSLWSGFLIPAFPEDAVPTDQQLPYITYTLVQSSPFEMVTHQVRVWYRTSSFAIVNTKVDEILSKVGQSLTLPHIVVFPGSPLVQYQPYDDPSIKVAYVNFDVLFL